MSDFCVTLSDQKVITAVHRISSVMPEYAMPFHPDAVVWPIDLHTQDVLKYSIYQK